MRVIDVVKTIGGVANTSGRVPFLFIVNEEGACDKLRAGALNDAA